jgi:steroid delta-isomerase-like uncharacterized protein
VPDLASGHDRPTEDKMIQQVPSAPISVATQVFEALNNQDLDAVMALDHPDVVDDFVVLGRLEGREAVRDFFSELFGAFPDFRLEVLNVVGDDTHAVVQWHANGTFSGTPFQGIRATGRSVDLRGCDVMKFDDGKLRNNTIYYDGLAFARQIGMLPREGSPADKAITAAFNASTDVKARLSQRRRTTDDG